MQDDLSSATRKLLLRPDTLLPEWGVWAMGALALAVVAVWVALHVVWGRLRNPWTARGMFAVRLVVAGGALWLILQTAGRVVLLATAWPLWQPAALGAVVIEGTIALGARERRGLSRWWGRSLTALRVVLAAVLVGVLAQPIFSSLSEHRRVRVVAVLVDESASMGLVDKQLSASEKVELARVFRADVGARPVELSASGSALRAAGSVLAGLADKLEGIESQNIDRGSLRRQLAGQEADLAKALRQAKGALTAARKSIGSALSGTQALDASLRQELARAQADLSDQGRAAVALAQAGEVHGRGSQAMIEQSGALRDGLRRAALLLQTAGARALALGRKVDEQFFAALSARQRQAIDRAVQASRQAVARQVLGGAQGLLEKLSKKYTVRLYRFAREPDVADPAPWTKGQAPAPGGAAQGHDDAWPLVTDYRAALARAIKDIPGEELAGALMVTDGQHNVSHSAEPEARRMGRLKAPVCSLLVGSLVPPVDAAVAGVTAPESVYFGDRVSFDVDLKIANLRGQDAKVRLMLKDTVVEEKTLSVPQAYWRTRVQFSHRPAATGVFEYCVEVEPFKNEPITINNRYPVHVGVVDDRTKLLIAEYRPRWEFRYIRNLFAGRDRSVFLQYVLLRPDQLAGAARREVVHASVMRDFADAEATALPEKAEDWLKFDVILLGDIPPAELTPPRQQILKQFVSERGGTLIVVAGPTFMPHALADPTFREMLPMDYEPTDDVQWHPPEPAYRLRLTLEGGEHPVMQQADNAAVTRQVWARLPKLYWRHPTARAKPGATVLAYAEGVLAAPDTGEPAAAAGADAEGRQKADRERQRRRALIAVRRYGSGRVLMLSFDRTWRLRYRVGDRRHHSFWGQALRWATSERLQAGTKRVRLGTDRLVYAHDQSVIVRARVLDKNLAPVPNGTVRAKVWLDGDLVLTRALTYSAKDGGVYVGDLGHMPKSGTYRIELAGADVAAQMDAPGEKVETEITVLVSDTGEMVELMASPAVVNRLAAVSGGAVETPGGAMNLLPYFGKGSEAYRRRRDVSLWDSWLVLAIILMALSAEWIFRKRKGLT